MIKDFIPGFDEAEATKADTKWARMQPDRDNGTCEIINTKTQPHDLANANTDTLDRIDEEFINGLKDR